MTTVPLIDIVLVLVFVAALAVGIWAGVRKYRELGRIARDALASPHEHVSEAVRSKLARPPTTVRPFFRILGLVAGPLMLLGGVAFLGMSLWALVTNGFHRWWSGNREFTVTGFGGLAIGFLITRAAVTGRDPYLR